MFYTQMNGYMSNVSAVIPSVLSILLRRVFLLSLMIFIISGCADKRFAQTFSKDDAPDEFSIFTYPALKMPDRYDIIPAPESQTMNQTVNKNRLGKRMY